MKNNINPSQDKTKNESINICLNCTKKKCTGECSFKKNKSNKKG